MNSTALFLCAPYIKCIWDKCVSFQGIIIFIVIAIHSSLYFDSSLIAQIKRMKGGIIFPTTSKDFIEIGLHVCTLPIQLL